MTQYVGASGTGRSRGLLGLAKAWVGVIGRPRRFFQYAVAPADQAPGVTFLAAVVLLEEAIRLGLVPDAYLVFGSRPLLSAAVWLLAATVILAPVGVHLVAAIQTVFLAVAAPDRAGVSETIQVLCYATAPCVLAGVPSPWLRAVLVAYGAGLYLLGIHLVHDLPPLRSVAVGALPAALVFGLGFRGFDAFRQIAWIIAGALDLFP